MKKMVILFLLISIVFPILAEESQLDIDDYLLKAKLELLKRYDYGLSIGYLPMNLSLALGCMEEYPVLEDIYYWNMDASEWEHAFSYYFAYDGEYLSECEVTIQIEDLTYLMTTTYVWDDGLLIETNGTTTVMNVTTPGSHETYTYTDSDIWDTYLMQGWQPDQEIWIDVERSSAVIESEKIVQVLYEEYDYETSSWIPEERESMTWDGEEISQDLCEYYDSGTWINENQGLKYYLPSGLMDYTVNQNWYMGNWENDHKVTYTYENGLHVYDLTHEWEEGSWVENEEQYLTYDSSDRPILIEQFEMIDGNWVEESKFEISYTLNEDNNAIVKPSDLISAYPNPFNPVTTISWQSDSKDKSQRLSIYDITGRRVFETNVNIDDSGQGQYIWNGRDNHYNVLPSGMYFVKISKSNLSHKIILLK